MSAIAILGVAVVCAGALCIERWQVSREASLRRALRRERDSWRGWTPWSVAVDVRTQHLAWTLEQAVVDADVAWSYRRRFETRRGESPFEIRRARADAALARYGRSLDRVARVATRWLEEREDHLGALQRRHAVERLLRFLRERPPGFSGAWVELGVDLLEHALANVLAHPDRPIRSHPFR